MMHLLIHDAAAVDMLQNSAKLNIATCVRIVQNSSELTIAHDCADARMSTYTAEAPRSLTVAWHAGIIVPSCGEMPSILPRRI